MILTSSFWPADRSVLLVEHTVGGLLRLRTGEQPSADALVGVAHDGTPVRLTYAELLDEAERVATALSALTRPGEFVALWAPNVAEWPVIEYGAALAGVVLVALNPVLREHELEYALQHSGAVVLLHADRSRDYELAPVAAAMAGRCPQLRHIISLSERDGWQARQTALLSGREPTDPSAPVMLQYTSGTTGLPKGVLLAHRSLVNCAALTLDRAGVAPGAAAVNPLPMFHTAACVISTLGPLWVGGKVVLVHQFAPGPVLESMIDEKVEVLFYVPTVLGALIAAQRASSVPAPRLHTALGGASNVPASMIEAASEVFGASVITLFGQTELSPVLTATRPADARADQLSTVGRPLPQVDCAVLDPDTGAVAPLGVPGEICARGYQQMIEYLHDPQATAAAVDADGFLHTGDLGTMDERGYLTVTGRIKDLIIRGGENIAPAEIETCLAAHPDVTDVAVFGVPDDYWGESVAAAIRIDGTPSPGLAASLAAFAGERLARFKVPVHWYVTAEFPATPTGKVQKFKLREWAGSPRLPVL